MLARRERPLRRFPLLRLRLRCLRLPDVEEDDDDNEGLESSESLPDEVEESESDEESPEVLEVEDEDFEELAGPLPLAKRFNANPM